MIDRVRGVFAVICINFYTERVREYLGEAKRYLLCAAK